MEKRKRLQKLIDYYTNGNKRQFAKMLGTSPQNISTWLSRDTFDSELILAKCEHLNAEWLLTGKGEMFKDEEEQPQVDDEGRSFADYKHILNEQLSIITALTQQLSRASSDLNRAMSVIERLAGNRHTYGSYMAAEDLHNGKDDPEDNDDF